MNKTNVQLPEMKSTKLNSILYAPVLSGLCFTGKYRV